MSFERKNIDPKLLNKTDILREGMKFIHESDWVVADREEIPEPEIDAVVAIWMDMTGSMFGEPIKMAKNFMFNLKALLSTKYKNTTFRYIGFADIAKVYEQEEDFFKNFINGGTNYAVGIKKTQEILEEYNNFSVGLLCVWYRRCRRSKSDRVITRTREVSSNARI